MHIVKVMLKKILQKVVRRKFQYMAENPRYSVYSIGRYSYGEPNVVGDGDAKLTIGSFCSIASGVQIILGGNHRIDWVTTFPFSVLFDEFKHIPGHPTTKGDVTIGNDVWIGGSVLILSGVTIGDGAVIGAHSVVAKDVEPYSIVVGNPAREVRKRFSEQTIQQLLEMQWWTWELERIKSSVPQMLSTDIDKFIEQTNAINEANKLCSEALLR